MDGKLLTDYGIDYNKGLRNCMGNADFFKKILDMFLKDDCFRCAKEAYENRDYEELFHRMHELKGVSGNAALIGLYDATVPLVELLRCGTAENAEVDCLFAAVETAYCRSCDGIAFITEKL